MFVWPVEADNDQDMEDADDNEDENEADMDDVLGGYPAMGGMGMLH